MEGDQWMHVPHGTSKRTFELFSITTKPLQARRTEFLTDSMAPLHAAFMNRAPGSLGAPYKVRHALMMVDVVCLALHTMSSDNSKSVGSPLAFGDFTRT